MKALIAELERAKNGSREFDSKIWEQLGLVDERHCDRWCKMDGRTDLTRKRFINAWAPHYTISLDAAIALVPEGMRWCISDVGQIGAEHLAFAGVFGSQVGSECDSNAPTPALALCLAALRARQAMKEVA